MSFAAIANSPGLAALMNACSNPHATSPLPSMTLPASTLPPTPQQTHTLPSSIIGSKLPITGMSILQLASPSTSNHTPASPYTNSMMPPPQSPRHTSMHGSTRTQELFAKIAASEGRTLPPPNSIGSMIGGGQQHVTQLPLAAAASQPVQSSPNSSVPAADTEDDVNMTDDDEDLPQDDSIEQDSGSRSSGSAPTSPSLSAANSVAALGGDATSTSARRASGVMSKSALMNLSGRRRSVGSHSHALASGTSDDNFKRPKVTSTAVAPGFLKKKAAPSSGAGANGANSESQGGSSCHQCKSRRNYADLTYCSSSLNKKKGNAVCRKKFCEHCLKKFYKENAQPSAGPSALSIWTCPSCRKICCCAACRRREQRDDASGGGGNSSVTGDMSTDVTPMPTPLYRGEHEMSSHLMQPSSHGNHLVSPSHASTSPSPSALSMQRLLLSPTMTPLPQSTSSVSSKGNSLLHPSSRLVTPVKQRSVSGSPHSSSSLASHSPPPLEGSSNHTNHSNHVPQSHQASLNALSQAAMSSPNGRTPATYGNEGPHSITISLQNHVPAIMNAGQHHHPPSGSLASSTVTSPSNHIQTPKATSTSLYSSLLLNSGNGSTPRLMPRVPTSASGANTPSSSTIHKSSSQPMQLASLLPIANNTNSFSTNPTTNAVSAAGSTTSSTDMNEESRGASDNAMNGVSESRSGVAEFALFYAVSQLPQVQKAVDDVMLAQDGTKNAQRLKRIEEIFLHFTEKVTNEEIPLQLTPPPQ